MALDPYAFARLIAKLTQDELREIRELVLAEEKRRVHLANYRVGDFVTMIQGGRRLRPGEVGKVKKVGHGRNRYQVLFPTNGAHALPMTWRVPATMFRRATEGEAADAKATYQHLQ